MIDRFTADILSNDCNRELLQRWSALALPGDGGWLVAGCLFQTVWNRLSGQPVTAQINDYDVFYYDESDLSESTERRHQARIDQLCADLPIRIEIANQARVHLWYPQYFGEAYPRLLSSRDGIRRFLVLSTCVGVRPAGDASLQVCAPYGLDDLYAGWLAPNPLVATATLYAAKAASYQTRWPWLRVAPFNAA